MRQFIPLLIAALALASQAAVSAKGPPMLDGYVSEQRVEKLASEIPWYQSLPKALEAGKQSGKLVVWVHMLGKIDGAT